MNHARTSYKLISLLFVMSGGTALLKAGQQASSTATENNSTPQQAASQSKQPGSLFTIDDTEVLPLFIVNSQPKPQRLPLMQLQVQQQLQQQYGWCQFKSLFLLRPE